MRVWRICREAYAEDPLSGKGGLYASGRWHRKGTLIVYTSGRLSLAALELFVNVNREVMPADLVQVEIEIPREVAIEEVKPGALPADWRATPAPVALQDLGADWLRRQERAVLRVPSAVIPEENNYLINPAHSDLRRIAPVGVLPFSMDTRLIP